MYSTVHQVGAPIPASWKKKPQVHRARPCSLCRGLMLVKFRLCRCTRNTRLILSLGHFMVNVLNNSHCIIQVWGRTLSGLAAGFCSLSENGMSRWGLDIPGHHPQVFRSETPMEPCSPSPPKQKMDGRTGALETPASREIILEMCIIFHYLLLNIISIRGWPDLWR